MAFSTSGFLKKMDISKTKAPDYFLNVEASQKTVPQLAEAIESDAPIKENLFGAFERYAEGHGRKGSGDGAGDVSCACHWTVNQSVSQG